MNLSFVVPVHNEEKTVAELHRRIREMCVQNGYTYELIVVDDGSEDGSFAALEKITKEDRHVKVLQLTRNFGQTAALSAGIHAAIAPLIVTLDADLQNDPADIPAMLAKMDEGFDVVSGWRKNRKDSFGKRIPSRFANSLISRVTGVKLSDYGCTLKIYRKEYLQNAPLYGDMHRFIPVLAAWHGAKVVELPVTHHPRAHGRSHYGTFGRTGRVLLDLLTVKFLHSYIARPMHFFGAIGFFFMGVGSVAGLTAIVLRILEIRDFVATPLPLFAAFTFLIGVQALLMGLLGELLIRIYFDQPGRKSYAVRKSIGIDTKGA